MGHSCHGGLYITKQVLSGTQKRRLLRSRENYKACVLKRKDRPHKAEAVMGIISAHGKDRWAKPAFSALEGALYKEIHKITDVLLKIMWPSCGVRWITHDEIEDLTYESILDAVTSSKAALKELLNRFDAGQAITEGTETAIVGRLNVGKSTLMNMLTGNRKINNVGCRHNARHS